MRQADVAELAGCSRSLISSVEANYTPPYSRRVKLAEALGITGDLRIVGEAHVEYDLAVRT